MGKSNKDNDVIDIAGVKVRERRVNYRDNESGVEHTAIFVENMDGYTLFAPEFLAHSNDHVRAEVVVALPGHDAEVYVLDGYDVTAHALVGRRVQHQGQRAKSDT